MRTLLALAAGAAIGALVGHSQVLCPTGTCAITGSWMGGGVVGGLMGMTLVGFVPVRPAPPRDDEPAAAGDDDDDRERPHD